MERPRLKFESSWDDGRLDDLKLVSLLRKYKLPAVFYLPTMVRDLSDSQVIDIAQDFEIGGHTMTHPADMKALKSKDIWWEISENKKELETLIGKKINKFCYPRGRYDQRAIDAAKSSGYTECRTTHVLKLGANDKFRKGTTIHVFQRSEYKIVHWVDVAKEYVLKAAENGGTFHIWGHSWEIERDENWQALDNLFEWISKNFEIENVN